MGVNNPFQHFVLLSKFGDVSHPEQKIKYLSAQGKISQIQRGWYIDNSLSSSYSKFHIANLLYGPSYVSGLSALSYLGWIADKTYTVQSIVFKRGKILDTEIGRFQYSKIKREAFSLGLTRVKMSENTYCLMANPTKALYDYLIFTPNLHFTGKDDLFEFLEVNLRFDVDRLDDLDLDLVLNLSKLGIKERQTNILYQLLKRHQS